MMEMNFSVNISNISWENSTLKIAMWKHNIYFKLVKIWFLNKIHKKMDAGKPLII